MKLSKRAENIDGSGIRKIANLSSKYENVISFTIGEPDFTASNEVVEQAYKAIRDEKQSILQMRR